jgi:hypothetical protein
MENEIFTKIFVRKHKEIKHFVDLGVKQPFLNYKDMGYSVTQCIQISQPGTQ